MTSASVGDPRPGQRSLCPRLCPPPSPRQLWSRSSLPESRSNLCLWVGVAMGRGVLPAILPTNSNSSMSSVLHPRHQWAKPTKGGTHRTSTSQGKKQRPERSGNVPRVPQPGNRSRLSACRAALARQLSSLPGPRVSSSSCPLRPPAHILRQPPPGTGDTALTAISRLDVWSRMSLLCVPCGLSSSCPL